MHLVQMLPFAFIGFVGSFLSGLIGMGGAIFTYPMLLYIPKATHVSTLSPHQVSGMISLQVTFAAVAALFALRSKRLVQLPLVGYMGFTSLVGSFCGGFGAAFLSGSVVNLLYATLATAAAIMMFVPKRAGAVPDPSERVSFHRGIAMFVALVIGMVSGIVGVGGGFLMIPAMVWLLNIPLRTAIACSMAITLLSSVSTSIAKLLTSHIPVLPAVLVIAASVLAAPMGVRVALRLDTRWLKTIAGALILLVSVKIWFDSI